MIFATIQQWESIVLAERKKQIFILSFLFFQIFSSAWDQGMISIIKRVRHNKKFWCTLKLQLHFSTYYRNCLAGYSKESFQQDLNYSIKRYFILKLWFLLKEWNGSLIRNQSENINLIVSHCSRVKCDRRYPNSHLLWDVWKLNCNMCRIIFKRLIINKDCGVVCRTFISDTATRCSCCFTNKRVSISLHTILVCISRPFYLSHRNHNLKMKNFLIQ